MIYLTREEESELVNLYHLARTALADKPYSEQSKYHRRIWASDAFAKQHTDVSNSRAYKELERLLA